MIHILLSGGSGSRLWPLSRPKEPKQFIPFFEGKSLFQKNYWGNKQIASSTIVVCNSEHFPHAQKQLGPDLQASQFILEPEGKNTTAAICLACQSVPPDATVLMTPSDHHIEYGKAYYEATQQAKKLAQEDKIVVFGISPTRPETGYGYIESLDGDVKKFHEKPQLSQAIHYISSGRFYWNSGMLCFKAKTFIQAMQRHHPEILEKARLAFQQGIRLEKNVTQIRVEDMAAFPSISIDYALLEKMDGLKMVPCTFAWSDFGSFDSMFFELEKDSAGNAKDCGSFYGINAKNNLIFGKNKIIAAIDVEDLVIIDTEDALLVAKAGSTQKVREIVAALTTSSSPE